MHVFLDFEASSLSDDSYPIEVGWAFEDGRTEAHLIRPAPTWTDWNPRAEALHGISRAMLEDGEDPGTVAHRILETLSAHAVYASAPSWDGQWLSTLFRAAGLPRHSMRLKDTDEAQISAAAAVLAPVTPAGDLKQRVEAVVQRARDVAAYGRPAHRAAPDAVRELRVWQEVRRQAEAEAARLRS